MNLLVTQLSPDSLYFRPLETPDALSPVWLFFFFFFVLISCSLVRDYQYFEKKKPAVVILAQN